MKDKLRKNGFGERGDKGFIDDVFKRIHEHFSSKGDKISYKDYSNFFLDADLSKLTFDESNIEGLLLKHLQNIFNNWDEESKAAGISPNVIKDNMELTMGRGNNIFNTCCTIV